MSNMDQTLGTTGMRVGAMAYVDISTVTMRPGTHVTLFGDQRVCDDVVLIVCDSRGGISVVTDAPVTRWPVRKEDVPDSKTNS